MSRLFEPLQLTPRLCLPNRVAMAPMTRCMAGQGGTPTTAMAEYYARRAAAGLIVSEAIVVSKEALGYPNVPGLFAAPQLEGWRRVTEAVHEKGGRIFAQIWHTGRAAHSYFSECQPVAPSAVTLHGTVPRMRRLSYEEPRALLKSDLSRICDDFVLASRNAVTAGFDGIEIHGANGYLLDQFLHYSSNQRCDEYGGDPTSMVRYPLYIVDAVAAELGDLPLGIRVSPTAHTNMLFDARDREVFDVFLAELGHRKLAYVHLGLFDDQTIDAGLGMRPSEYLMRTYPGVRMGAGGYEPDSAERSLELGRLQVVAWGRLFIANPDLVARLRAGEPLRPYDPGQLMRLS